MISKKASLMQEVYIKLKKMIILNELHPGDLITVGDLAERFNVSKTPVRDSLNTLKHEGLIEVLPYKGFLVSRIDVKELLDLFQMREIMEAAAVEMAIQNINPGIAESLTESAQSTCENDKVSFMLTNFNFHMAVAKSSGNKYLCKFLSNILEQLQRVLYTDLLSVGDPAIMQKEHQELVRYIVSKDIEKAKMTISGQIEATRNRVLKNI